MKSILPVAEAIEKLLHPHAEVVVHDVRKNQIVAIFNPFSKRRVGDSSLFTPEEEMATLQDCIGPYEKINWNGDKLKSVSSVIRDKNNRIVGLLCINLNVAMFEKFAEILNQFVDLKQLAPQPQPLFKDDWQERLHQYIHQYLQSQQLTLNNLNRHEKKQLIEHLHQQGAFSGKNAATYIAEILHVSRATVYNYLQNEN